MIEQLLTGRHVTIDEAKNLETNPLIWWRPQPNLPEPEQFAIIFEE
jgi:hypothetical protein